MLRKTGKVNYEIDMKDKKIFHVTMLKNGTHQMLNVSEPLRK